MAPLPRPPAAGRRAAGSRPRIAAVAVAATAGTALALLAASAWTGPLRSGVGSTEAAARSQGRMDVSLRRGSLITMLAAKEKVVTNKKENKDPNREIQPWEEDYPMPPIKVFAEDFGEDKIKAFYEETIVGKGGPPPAGPVQDIITKYFLWDGKPRRGDYKYNAQEHETGFKTMKDMMQQQTWITYGGHRQATPDDKSGWVWLAAEETVMGLCLQIYKSVPYGRRPLLIARADDSESIWDKVNWSVFEKRLETELGTLLREEPRPPEVDDWMAKFRGEY